MKDPKFNLGLEEYYRQLGIEDHDDTVMHFAHVPNPVGWWRIGADEHGMYGTYFPVFNKPTDKQIQNHLKMLGWVYVEKFI